MLNVISINNYRNIYCVALNYSVRASYKTKIKHVQVLYSLWSIFIFSTINVVSRTTHFTCSAYNESNSATHV